MGGNKSRDSLTLSLHPLFEYVHITTIYIVIYATSPINNKLQT